MNRVGLVEPKGNRSTCWGGSWEFAKDERENLNHMRVDQRAISPGGDRQLPDLELTMFRQELRARMRDATDGRLRYGPSPKHVQHMSIVTDVLEMRMLTRRTVSNERIHARLYFSEPAEHDDLLLSLMLAWKSPGKIGKKEQNEHATTAQRRFDKWVAERGDPLQH